MLVAGVAHVFGNVGDALGLWAGTSMPCLMMSYRSEHPLLGQAHRVCAKATQKREMVSPNVTFLSKMIYRRREGSAG